MKVPVEIDLRKASFTRHQLGGKMDVTEGVNLAGCAAGGFRGPITKLQIIERASAARLSCGWDKDAIFSWRRFLVTPSLRDSDSSLILVTRIETWVDIISGKLHHKNGMNRRR